MAAAVVEDCCDDVVVVVNYDDGEWFDFDYVVVVDYCLDLGLTRMGGEARAAEACVRLQLIALTMDQHYCCHCCYCYYYYDAC